MTDTPSAPAFEVSDLVKTYRGITAVNKISFNVDRGEIIGFLGPNGAGKSTTMRILTGYIPATSGTVRVCGIPVATRAEEVKRIVGYMPENNPLPEDMRVSEYLYYRGRLKEIPRSRLGPRLDEVLERCDLTRVRHRILGQLSKGNRQRVGIAEAILAEPPVIIMDEPTIGLDPHQILIVRDLIASLRGRMTVIISSHILPEIEMTCDRVLIINRGQLVAQGTPSELRREFLGRTRYLVEYAGDSALLAGSLKLIDPTLQIESSQGEHTGEATRAESSDGFRKVFLTTRQEADQGESIIRVLAAQPGIRLRSFTHSHPSLEDVFLAATKRSWDIVDSPPQR
ncbi:MAG: ABC transporter ATP-binding protein [Opitutaceae bacterium]|nr:ABC transporter ATP-binding protein [Opitutaceae bacterium]